MKIVILWTDVAVWMLLASGLLYAWGVARSPNLRASWRKETDRGVAALVKAGVSIAKPPDADIARPTHPSELAEAIAAALR